MRLNRFIRKIRQGKIESPGWHRPMDIAPGGYGEVDYPAIKKLLESALEENWGPRLPTKDYEDFPEMRGDDASKIRRCPACEAYERFDYFWEYFSPDDGDDTKSIS